MAEQPLIDPSKPCQLFLPAETQYAMKGIVSRTLLKTPTARLILFGFDVGQELSEHTAPYHALVQILAGECEFQMGGKLHRLKAGDFISMPPNTPHGVKATKELSMLLTLLPAPW